MATLTGCTLMKKNSCSSLSTHPTLPPCLVPAYWFFYPESVVGNQIVGIMAKFEIASRFLGCGTHVQPTRWPANKRLRRLCKIGAELPRKEGRLPSPRPTREPLTHNLAVGGWGLQGTLLLESNWQPMSLASCTSQRPLRRPGDVLAPHPRALWSWGKKNKAVFQKGQFPKSSMGLPGSEWCSQGREMF